MTLLKRVSVSDIRVELADPVNAQALVDARKIVENVRLQGETALTRYAKQYGELDGNTQLFYSPSELRQALEGLPKEQREVLERTAARILTFAESQRQCLKSLDRRAS